MGGPATVAPGSRHERSAARHGEPLSFRAGPQASHVGLPHSGIRPDESALQLQLQAFTETPEDAQEMHGVLSGLNEFAAAMADRSSSNAGAGQWGRVLRTAEFVQQGATVRALWQIDPALLRSRP